MQNDKNKTFIEKYVLPFRDEYSIFPTTNEGDFYISNGFFEAVDAEVLYGVIRSVKPKKIVEVGAGWSTKLIKKALSANNTDTALISIDPAPLTPVEKFEKNSVQNTPLKVFTSLGKNDILFIDSSHIYSDGSDVEFLLNSVLPVLKPGILVHFHDIFWPDPYPWTDRFYNEQEYLKTFLADNKDWKILFSSYEVKKNNEEFLFQTFPSYHAGKSPASLWITKTGRTTNAE